MELKLIPQSDEMKFQEWFDKHDGDLLYMECEDIARQSFMAGMKTAQHSVQRTGETVLHTHVFSGGCCACGYVIGEVTRR
jgi:hypothetical protein